MKAPSLAVPLSLCCAGFLAGFAGKRMTAAGGADPAVAAQNGGKAGAASGPERKTSDRGVPAADPRRAKAGGKIDLPSLHSTDTVASLLALGSQDAYTRVAVWMMNATEADIAEYWNSFKNQENQSNDLIDLTFLNWTRLNPQAAIDAVKDGRYNHYAWWAWAAHDPQAAFDAALAANPDRMNNVAWGLGEFHPEWLRAHFKDIPEAAIGNAMQGFGKWGDSSDPLEMLQFLKDNGRGTDDKTFKALVAKDPLAAFDWLKESGEPNSSPYDRYIGRGDGPKSAMDSVVDSLAKSQPDVLKRMADQESPGDNKRKMEAALFSQLLDSDPAAAMEQANTTKSPRVAAERLAAVGADLIRTDPDAAFKAADQMFNAYPDALNPMVWIINGGGGSGSPVEIPGVSDFVNQLMVTDPERLLGLPSTRTGSEVQFNSPAISQLEGMWAQSDLDSYIDWAQNRSDPAIRTGAGGAAINGLNQAGRYSEAAEWAASTQELTGNLYNVITFWTAANPDDAKAWLQAADLPETTKEGILKNLEANQSRNEQISH